MTASRKIEIVAALTSAVAAAFVLTACGSSAPAPAASPSASPTPAALSLAAACKLLRTDILGNGGTPDAATLKRIISQGTNPYLLIDVKAARRDLGANDGGMAMGFDLALMFHDCRRTGVQIPS